MPTLAEEEAKLAAQLEENERLKAEGLTPLAPPALDPSLVKKAMFGAWEELAGERGIGHSRPSLAEARYIMKRKSLTGNEALQVRAGTDGEGELLTEFHRLSDRYLLCEKMLPIVDKHSDRLNRDFPLHETQTYQELQALHGYLVEKAFLVDSAPGSAFLPQFWSDQLYLAEEMAPNVINHSVVRLDVPMAQYNMPVSGRSVMPLAGFKTDSELEKALGTVTPNAYTVAFKPAFCGVRVMIDETTNEASIIAAQPYLMRLMSEGIQLGLEQATVNGDKSKQLGDPGLLYPSDVRNQVDGLRAYAFKNSLTYDIGSNSGLSPTTVKAVRMLMWQLYRTDMKKMDLIVPNAVLQNLLTLDAFREYRTAFGIGHNPTALASGQIPGIMGSPLIESPAMSESLNSSGKDPGAYLNANPQVPTAATGQTLGTTCALMFLCRNAFALALHGGVRADSEFDSVTRMWNLTAVQYFDVQSMYAPSNWATAGGGDHFMGLGFNIAD